MNQEQLKAEFHYDPVTGVFRRRFAKPFSNRRPWSVAGSVATKGYLQISVDGKLFMAHRLAWMEFARAIEAAHNIKERT